MPYSIGGNILKRLKKVKQDSEKIGYVFILPAVLFVLIFVGYPIIYNIILGFQKVDLQALGTGNKTFVGFDNYIELFKNPVLKISLWNTLYFSVVCILLQFVIGFSFAILFNKDFKTAKFIRGLVMISWLVPVTVSGLIFKFMFAMKGGIINQMLMDLNIISQPIEWLIKSDSAMWSLIITNVWIGVPFNMILLTTGLSTIPASIYESADIDGTNWFQKLIYITIPSIKPAILAVVTLGFIYTFKVFDLVFIMTNGGPVNSTEVLSTLSYRYSFNDFNFSMGASVANILCLVLMIVSIIYIKYIKEDEVM